MFPLYSHHTFCVPRPREHIDRRALLRPVPMPSQIPQIPPERLGIAGDIHHPFRRKLHHGGEKRLITARSRRVHKHHIHIRLRGTSGRALRAPGRRPGFCHLRHKQTGIRIVKPYILDLIPLCVRDGVPHRVAVLLHADDLRGIPGRD